MNKEINQYHDKFFKELFSKKKQATEFLQKSLPKEIVENIDFNSLNIDKTEYVDKKLKTNLSDLVYNCKYAGKTTIKISLLLEHKSSPVKYPHFQLLTYIMRIWETQIAQKQKLTPVIPIIFYHGTRKWNKKKIEDYFEYYDDYLLKFLPAFDYHLIDTSNYSDKQIKKIFKDIELQVGLLLLKNIFDEYKILNDIAEIFADINEMFQTEEGENFFETIVAYILYSTQIDTQKYVENMKTLPPKTEKKFISTAMRLRLSGIEQGRKEGIYSIAHSLFKKGFSDEEIIEFTRVTKEELEFLKTLKEYRIDE